MSNSNLESLVMRTGRFLRLQLAVMLVPALLFAAPCGAAEPDKPGAATTAAAAAKCGGIDMLAEAQVKEPELYQRVMGDAAKVINTEAILWKVEKAGVPPSHLLGTIHLSDARVTTLSDKIRGAFDASKTVVLEFAGVSDTAMAAMIGNAGELLIYTDGRNLQGQLTPEEFAKVQGLVAKSGMPGEFAAMLRPWLINMLLAISDCERKSLETGAAALDSRLELDAKSQGKEVLGLETPQSQLAALASVPDEQQVQMLKAGLKFADRSDDMLETLVQMYVKRQLGATMPFQVALAEKAGVPASAFDGFLKILLVDRNAKMRDGALPILEKGNALIAVGALHMPGPMGLVALLRDAGYTVTAVE